MSTLARALKRCQRRHGACRTQRRALQRAGRRLQQTQSTLNRIARDTAKGTQASATLPAPTISVSGQKLSWNAVSNVSRYVLVRKVTGQADQYSVISGTSVTPPAVPGATVRYSVRADATGSAWASEVSITYAAISACLDAGAVLPGPGSRAGAVHERRAARRAVADGDRHDARLERGRRRHLRAGEEGGGPG